MVTSWDLSPLGRKMWLHVFSLTCFFPDMERCNACKKFRPFTSWDLHSCCPKCRTCRITSRCDICEDWTQDRWDALQAWTVEKRLEQETRRASAKKKPSRKSGKIPLKTGKIPKKSSREDKQASKQGETIGLMAEPRDLTPGPDEAQPRSTAVNPNGRSCRDEEPRDPIPGLDEAHSCAAQVNPGQTGGSNGRSSGRGTGSSIKPGNVGYENSRTSGDTGECSGQDDPEESRGSENPEGVAVPDSREDGRCPDADTRNPETDDGSVQAAWDTLFGDSLSGSQRDFDGFQDQDQEVSQPPSEPISSQRETENPTGPPRKNRKKKSKKAGKRSHKKRKRRHTSSSSSSSESSDSSNSESDSDSDGKSRKRRKRRKRHDSGNSDLLTQIKELFKLGASTIPETQPIASESVLPTPVRQPVNQGESTDTVNIDQPSTSHYRQPSSSRPTHTSDLPVVSHSDNDDSDDPLTGTEITKEAFDKGVEALRRLLGYETPVVPVEPEAKRSRLTLNTVKKAPDPAMPMDIECSDRLQTLIEKKHWTAFQAKPSRTFRMEEEVWQDIIRSPQVPEEARVKLKSAGKMNSSNKFTNSLSAKFDKALYEADMSARTGLKYASSLLLFAEVLSKSYQQADTDGISRKDTGAIVTLLGPISRLIFDQFARVMVRSTMERRELVLDALPWPSQYIKSSFQSLPMLGSDMFGGKFGEHLQQEATKQRTLKEAEFQLPKSTPYQRKPAFSRSSSYRNRSNNNNQRQDYRKNQTQRSNNNNNNYRGRGSKQYSNYQRKPNNNRSTTRGARRPYRP